MGQQLRVGRAARGRCSCGRPGAHRRPSRRPRRGRRRWSIRSGAVRPLIWRGRKTGFPAPPCSLCQTRCPGTPRPCRRAPPGTRFPVRGLCQLPANLHAARRPAQTLLPALRTVLPGAAGDDRGARGLGPARAPETPGLRVIDNPADLRPLYAEASAVMLPIAEGGGTRLKVLEALAAGRPIIATDKAVEGLGLIPAPTTCARPRTPNSSRPP